ncbi:MAG TPA: hypothetical protein VF841_10505 [Anaeromyxobacter sp.]
MRGRPLLLLALLAALPAAARAAGPSRGPDDDGILFGVRGGWALPSGDIAPGEPLDGLADAKLPLWLELGYRFSGHVRAEIYFELAPMTLASPCPSGAACSAFDVRSGLALQLHPAPRSWLDPWVGFGLGVEYLQATTPIAGGGVAAWQLSWYGVEVPVEVGLDLAISDVFTLGPYATVSFAQFTSASARPPGGATASGAIDRRATHGWGQAGLKMTLKL